MAAMYESNVTSEAAYAEATIRLFVFGTVYLFLNGHVAEFAGFKNLATFQTFHKLAVFLASDNLHPRMRARDWGFRTNFSWGGLRNRNTGRHASERRTWNGIHILSLREAAVTAL